MKYGASFFSKIFKREKDYKNNYELVWKDFRKLFNKNIDDVKESLMYMESFLMGGLSDSADEEIYLLEARFMYKKRIGKFFEQLMNQKFDQNIFERLMEDMFILSQEKKSKLGKKDLKNERILDELFQKFLLEAYNLANQANSMMMIEFKSGDQLTTESESKPKEYLNYYLALNEIERFNPRAKYFAYRKKFLESDAAWIETIEAEKYESLSSFKENLGDCEKKILNMDLDKKGALKLKSVFVEMLRVTKFDKEFEVFSLRGKLPGSKETYEKIDDKRHILAEMLESIISKKDKAFNLLSVNSKFATVGKNLDVFLNFVTENGKEYSFGQEISEKIIEYSGSDHRILHRVLAKRPTNKQITNVRN